MDYSALMTLSMQNIQIFLTVAEYGNMTKAAAVLNVTQPLLSQRIQRLEESLGITLFERTPRRMKLTPAGDYLYHQWGGLLGQLFHSVEEAYKIQEGKRNQLTIGLYSALGPKMKCRLSRDLINAFPDIQLEIPSVPLYLAMDGLYREQYDIILMPNYGTLEHSSEIQTLSIGRWPLFALISEQNPLSQQKSVHWEELQERTWMAVNSNPDYDSAMQAHAERHGFLPDLRHYNSDDTVRLNLQLNRGITIVMSYLLQDDGIQAIPIEDSDTALLLAWRKGAFGEKMKEFALSAAPIIKDVLWNPHID